MISVYVFEINISLNEYFGEKIFWDITKIVIKNSEYVGIGLREK